MHADSASELECTNDEVAKYCQKGDFIFQWVCTPVVCNIVYDYGNSSLSYYFDPVCRKCVSCHVGRCPTVPVMGDSDYCYADAESTDSCSETIECGEHGTLCSCYQCDCDDGWATDWTNPDLGYCSKQTSGGPSGSNTLAPNTGATTLSTTTIWIIVITVASVLVVLALVVCCVCIFRKRQSKVKLQEMMEEFQTNALEKQRQELEQSNRSGTDRADRNPQVHARSMDSESHHSNLELREVAHPGYGVNNPAGGSAVPGGGWLLHFCNEYKSSDPQPHVPHLKAAVGASSRPSEPIPDPLISRPDFKRQDTATMSSNSPTASLFPTSPGAALPAANSHQSISESNQSVDDGTAQVTVTASTNPASPHHVRAFGKPVQRESTRTTGDGRGGAVAIPSVDIDSSASLPQITDDDNVRRARTGLFSHFQCSLSSLTHSHFRALGRTFLFHLQPSDNCLGLSLSQLCTWLMHFSIDACSCKSFLFHLSLRRPPVHSKKSSAKAPPPPPPGGVSSKRDLAL